MLIMTLLVMRFVIDLTKKYLELIKPIEGEAIAPSLLWALSTLQMSV